MRIYTLYLLLRKPKAQSRMNNLETLPKQH